MTHTLNTLPKKDKHLSFQVELEWLNKKRGILTAHDVDGSLTVATPKIFDGEGNDWSPEHLLLGSITSCFMTTYLYFAKKLSLEIDGLECSINGRVELVEGRYEFTHIDLYPRICVKNESFVELARTVLEKTRKYCLVAHAIKREIIYHAEIIELVQKSQLITDHIL